MRVIASKITKYFSNAVSRITYMVQQSNKVYYTLFDETGDRRRVLLPLVYCFLLLPFFCDSVCYTINIVMSNSKGAGNQYIQLVKVLYCITPTCSKQVPDFQLEVKPGFELRSHRWQGSVLALCHSGPSPLPKFARQNALQISEGNLTQTQRQ